MQKSKIFADIHRHNGRGELPPGFLHAIVNRVYWKFYCELVAFEIFRKVLDKTPKYADHRQGELRLYDPSSDVQDIDFAGTIVRDQPYTFWDLVWVTDAKTIWLFHEHLKEVINKPFARFDSRIKAYWL